MGTEPTTYVYKSVGDCQIKADVYRPTDSNPNSSGIVWIHGGALITPVQPARFPPIIFGPINSHRFPDF